MRHAHPLTRAAAFAAQAVAAALIVLALTLGQCLVP